MTRAIAKGVGRRGVGRDDRPTSAPRPASSGSVVGAISRAPAAEHCGAAAGAALAAELESLESLSLEELRGKYLDIKGSALPKHLRRPFALTVVSHAAREKALGGLSREAQKRLDQLVAQIVPSGEASPPKQPFRKVKAGTRLLREWKGEVYEVLVAPDGFIWKGERRRSLSDIARTITGTRWNGWTFFGVGAPMGAASKSADKVAGSRDGAASATQRSARYVASQKAEPVDA